MPDRGPSASDEKSKTRGYECDVSSVSSILLQPAEFPAACKLTGAPLKLLEVNPAESAQAHGARTFGSSGQSLTASLTAAKATKLPKW